MEGLVVLSQPVPVAPLVNFAVLSQLMHFVACKPIRH